jgi:hypothetical protein
MKQVRKGRNNDDDDGDIVMMKEGKGKISSRRVLPPRVCYIE